MLPQRTNASATILCLLMVVILNLVYAVEQESVQQLQMICSNKFVHIEPTGVVHAHDASDHPQTITIISDIGDLLQRPKIPLKLFVKDVNMFLCYNKNWRLVGVEKRRISSHHRCEFYEAEERGYFRFQSTADTNKTVSFFKGSGKPYMEHQARASHKPKGRKCEEFVKVPAAPPQPKFNFPFEPIKPRPTPSTTTTTTTTSTTTTTTTPRSTTTSPAPRTTVTARATHRHRHQGHHHQQRQKELGTQEFSSATDTRLIRHQSHHNKQLQPQSPPSRRRKTKKQPPKRGQGQKNKQQQLQKVPSTSPRSRNGGLARKKPVEPRLRDYSDFMFLDAEALDQERKRAFALESEKALLRKEQRMADFGLTEDYWNDDNMIGSHEDAKWVAKRPPPPPPPGGKKKPSDSILISRLMGKGAGSGEAKSLFRPKSLGQKRVTALGSKEAGSSTTGISGKKRASMSPERLQNHHHHPSMSRRRS